MSRARPLRLGLLLAGETPDALASAAPPGGHAGFYFRWLDGAADITVVRALNGEIPEDPDAQDGWIVSGSVSAVYENHAWIPPLRNFLRRAAETRPLLGICFGHQLLAETFGGRVEKAAVGWGAGVHRYAATATPGWLGDRKALTMIAMHQDQVVTPPQGAVVHAGSDFCPVANFSIGPRVLGVQGHPEFDIGYLEALLDYRADRLSADADAAARASLAETPDALRDDLIGWFDRAGG